MTSPLPTQPKEDEIAVRACEMDLEKIGKMMEEMANQPKEELGKYPTSRDSYPVYRNFSE